MQNSRRIVTMNKTEFQKHKSRMAKLKHRMAKEEEERKAKREAKNKGGK